MTLLGGVASQKNVHSVFRFDGKTEQASKAAEKVAARLVTVVSSETRDAIRLLITNSIRDQISPFEASRLLRSMIGLNRPQMRAALNYRRSLVASGLAPDAIASAMEKYTAKKIRQRAIMIARTEIMNALNTGALESWKQAKKEGLLPDNTKKAVLVVGDESTCQICAPLNGQLQDLAKNFKGGPVDRAMPPFHPNCRCTVYVDFGS